MGFSYTPAKVLLATAQIDLSTADLRLLLVMANTTANSDASAAVIDDIVTLDEYNGANYARKTLAGITVTPDFPNQYAQVNTDPVTWTALGAGARQCVGMLLYVHVTDDTDSIPLAMIDSGGFPFDGDGTNVVMTPNSEGLLIVSG